MGMAQIVEPHGLEEPRRFQQGAVVAPQYVLFVKRCPFEADEDQLVLTYQLTLLDAVRESDFVRAHRIIDSTAALFGLGLVEQLRAFDALHGAGDANAAPFDVHVLPAQGQGFTGAQAGSEHEGKEGVVRRMLDGGQKASGLLIGHGVHLAPFLLGEFDMLS